ncbi:hypothetical protein ATANTOWER_008933 [Ataeniobius toweri]|uniref:Uncharacterized protein n=1 Tax=Ataeniobius toweri TaxID=208326 RepID=A0ABU7BFK3_9TELE|nr:hypothetical protein [Ataeniobius toweri]
MAAAPVRQRCGTGGPRSQLPPCYFEGYLEKRGPKEKVGPVHHIPAGMQPVVRDQSVLVVGVGCSCAPPPACHTVWSTIPRYLSTSLLCWDGRGSLNAGGVGILSIMKELRLWQRIRN